MTPARRQQMVGPGTPEGADSSAVGTAGGNPFQHLLPSPGCLCRVPFPDGRDRPAVLGDALLQVETDEGLSGEVRSRGEPEAGAAADARHGALSRYDEEVSARGQVTAYTPSTEPQSHPKGKDMSTQMEALDSTFWQLIIEMPGMEDSGIDDKEDNGHDGHSFDHGSSNAARIRLAEVAVSLLTMEPEQRLDSLGLVNPALTENHLDEIARKTEEWLDSEARERIRTKAIECYEMKSDPKLIVINWNTEMEVERLVELLVKTSIPDKNLAICYAMARATEICMATFTIHAERQKRSTEPDTITQTPDEIAADLRFANAG